MLEDGITAQQRADILADVSALRFERLGLLAWLAERSEWEKAGPHFFGASAIIQRRIDKIEERFSLVGLAKDGFERVL